MISDLGDCTASTPMLSCRGHLLTLDVIDVLETVAADLLQLLDGSLLGQLLDQLHNPLVKMLPLEPPVYVCGGGGGGGEPCYRRQG